MTLSIVQDDDVRRMAAFRISIRGGNVPRVQRRVQPRGFPKLIDRRSFPPRTSDYF